MCCAFHDQFFLRGSTVFVNGIAHAAWNKGVSGSMDKKNGNSCFLYFSCCIAVIQTVAGAFAVDSVGNLHNRKSRKVDHGVKYMSKYLFWGGEGAVGDDPFYLFRKCKTACHQDSGTTHGGAVEQDPDVFAAGFQYPVEPFQSIHTVQAAETYVSAFAFPVGAFVYQKHGISMGKIVTGKSGVIVHAPAGVAMKADDDLFAFFLRKPGGMKLQSVIRLNPDILVGLGQHGVLAIAQKAGIGKGSIYYYFPSKDAILDALVERNYEKPLETAKELAKQTDIPPFTRMAMVFQACRKSSAEFRKQINNGTSGKPVRDNTHEEAYIHQKYLKHLITQLKPALTEIIQQGIDNGEIYFDYPAALAEIVLIVLAVKMDNTLLPGTPGEIEETIRGLISLLEKGTQNVPGALNFLTLL